jgi:hypothetical protein
MYGNHRRSTVLELFKNVKKVVAMGAIATMLPAGMAMAAPSAQEVIDKYIEATGGKDAISAQKNQVRKGQFNLVDMGMAAGLEMYNAPPNFKNRINIEGMGEVTQGITGDVVWQVHFMEGDSILEGDAAQGVRQQAEFEPLLNWSKYYDSAEYDGEEDGNHKLKLVAKGSGSESTMYFSKDSGLLVKSDGMGLDGSPATTMFSEYKDIGGGVKAAHKMEIAGGMTVEMTFETIEVDACCMPEDTFALPESITALLPAEEEATGVTAEQILAQMDTNGDGKIDMDEAPEQLSAAFGMVDANADGGIDLEEAQMIADFMNGQ